MDSFSAQNTKIVNADAEDGDFKNQGKMLTLGDTWFAKDASLCAVANTGKRAFSVGTWIAFDCEVTKGKKTEISF